MPIYHQGKYLEGFWRETLKNTEDSPFPYPEPNRDNESKKKRLLGKLAQVELEVDEDIRKRSHYCLFCQAKTGSIDYKIPYKDSMLYWPQGFSHYLEKHSIDFSHDFYERIMSYQLNDTQRNRRKFTISKGSFRKNDRERDKARTRARDKKRKL